MIRRRIALRGSALARLGSLLSAALALILIWYGLMLVLLAAKVAPHTVNSISGYSTIYVDAANLSTREFTTSVRLIAGFGGLLAFVLFVALTVAQLPRPYLARGAIELVDDARGRICVEPRAIERVAEISACAVPNVTNATCRLGDNELSLSISLRSARTVGETLSAVQRDVAAALARHELPPLAVNVLAAGYQPKTTRELS